MKIDSGGMAFAPDGRHLATAHANGTVYIHRIEALASEPARVEEQVADCTVTIGISLKCAFASAMRLPSRDTGVNR